MRRSALLLTLSALAACATSQRQAPVTAPVATPIAHAAPDTVYDVVIRNGRVLDGEGNPFILADVGIHNGKFTRIGVIPQRGAREIDAHGLYVSPGWIDMMDQSGGVLPRN